MASIEDRSCDPDTRFKALSAQANNVSVDKNIPPRRYFRSGLEMERMAVVYLEESNCENAFVLYMKYIVLFVEKLPKHPLYKQADQVQVRKILSKVKKIFPITEKLRETIKKKYHDEYEEWKTEERQRIAEQERIQKQQAAEQQRKKDEEDRLSKFQVAKHSNHQLDFRPSAASIITPTAPFLEADYPTAPSISAELGPKVEDPGSIPIKDLPPPPPYSSIPNTPEIPHANFQVPDFRMVVKPSPVPVIDRASKPLLHLDRQISTPIGGVRRMYVPQELISRFITIASYNTRNNLETCGILTGKLAMNVFHVSHLVIPKQTATPDSCTTMNEEEMFEVQDKYDLVTLGWIHTHPTQTSFLSSVDLHTQYAYQIMMPEAIAIVCAPKYNQVGVYRLTSDHGLPFIGSCSKPGFHPHPKEPPLFEESEHAQIDNTMKIKVIDLR